MKLITLLPSSLLTFSLLLSGCGNSETTNEVEGKSEHDSLTVYTTIYPLEDFTKKIGGDFVNVKSVYPPNVDAHSYEPSTKDMIAMADSDLFIYTGVGIEGFAEKAAESLKKEDVHILKAADGIELLETTHDDEHQQHEGEEVHSEKEEHTDEHGNEEEFHNEEEHSEEHGHQEEGHSDEEQSDEHAHEGDSVKTEQHSDEEHHNHGDLDPHVWLDPILSIELAENIKNTLSELLPEHASEFENNFNQLKIDLTTLDQEFRSTIESSRTKYVLVAHEAYGYWESRYGIKQIAIAGISPTQEPTQKGLQQIIEESNEHQIHYVIFEQNVTPKVAKIIQNELGAKSLTLHNLEAITDENKNQKDDYFSIMRKNLETLKTALNE
jgi:zinc transport system substrate-binding protein